MCFSLTFFPHSVLNKSFISDSIFLHFWQFFLDFFYLFAAGECVITLLSSSKGCTLVSLDVEVNMHLQYLLNSKEPISIYTFICALKKKKWIRYTCLLFINRNHCYVCLSLFSYWSNWTIRIPLPNIDSSLYQTTGIPLWNSSYILIRCMPLSTVYTVFKCTPLSNNTCTLNKQYRPLLSTYPYQAVH